MAALTTEAVAVFKKGGQLSILNRETWYRHRGAVEAILIVEKDGKGKLAVKLAWKAVDEGYPDNPSRWVREDDLDFEADLDTYNIGWLSSGCLVLASRINANTVTLHPLRCKIERLDPARVEGLVLAGVASVQ